MTRLREWLGGFLPRRRLRSWRYVSPRRHGAGVAILLAIACAIYAYWYFTNDGRIRQQAQTYLSELTGGDWRIRHAHFSLFGGIELKGVELRVPGRDAPFFRAERVSLRHQPWTLLRSLRLDVREITCDGTEVRLTYDVARDSWVYPKLRFSMGAGEAGSEANGMAWPPLVARQAKVLRTDLLSDRDGTLDVQRAVARTDIIGMAVGNTYQVALAGGQSGPTGLSGSVSVNMFTGEVRVTGAAFLDDAIFKQFAQLKYIHGQVKVTGSWDPQSGQGVLDANFLDASMSLPPELGGLRLHSIRGQLHLDSNGAWVQGISGQVTEAGDARLSLSGTCRGLELNSPFDLRLAVAGFELPRQLDGNSAVADLVRYIREHNTLEGRLNIAAHVQRGADGRLSVEGSAEANDLLAMDKSFPYELRHAQVDVRFTDQWLEFRRLSGTHGTARIEVGGRVRFPPEGKTYDLLVRASGVTVDDDIKKALSPQQQEMCDAFSPAGQVGARVRVHIDAPGEAEKQEVTILLDGEASVEYWGFPYRISNAFGEVVLNGSDIAINSIHCSSPQMACTVDGSVRLDANFDGDANLTITARLPLDQRLADALGPSGKAAFAALHPSGMAQNVQAQITKHPGQPPQYHVTAEVDHAGFTFDRFPYAVTDANGVLVLEPNRVTIRGISARHKDTPMTMSGTVTYDDAGVSTDLQLDAVGVQADQELFQAVPASVQRVWKQIAPAGLADVGFQLHWKTLDDPNDMDYTCRIQARDMRLKYVSFPYELRGLQGLAIVTPQRVELRDVKATDGRMKLTMAGVISADPKEDRAELSLRAEEMPLSSELLAALPMNAAPIFGRLKPGGSCSLNLSRLVLTSSRFQPATGPAPATGPSAATAPVAPLAGPITDWLVEGEMAFRDANIDLGIPTKLTGGLSGRVAKTPGGLTIDANVVLGNLAIHQRVVTDVSGHLWKDANSSLLHVDDILGKAYGGRLAGFAEIRPGDAPQYGLRLFAENMNLNEILNASIAEPNQRVAVEGLLDATIELKASGGDKPVRYVSGLLHMTKAKTQKVPVLVDQLQPLVLSLPDSFSEGVLEYTLKGDKLLFREIHLDGPGISVVGSGTMNLKNEALKLTFLRGASIVPRMDNLADELIGNLLRGLVEVQVSGTLKKPIFRTVALPNVEAIVRKLLNPDAD